jgi:prepilin-type N-terminal cleavage/methylation domain-containing protein
MQMNFVTRIKTSPAADQGFTLVEIAVVMLIIALLMTGLVPTISSQFEQQRTNETRKKLDEIRGSLLGFAVANGRLPYPACGTIAANTINAGIELSPASAAVCATGTGDITVLPWATLGISETDGWERRFSYSVTGTFADTTDGTGTGACNNSSGVSFQLCSNGDLFVKDSAAGNNIASSLPVVVVSHGSNGCGAYTPSGSKISIATGDSSGGDCSNAGADQVENADGTTNKIFVSHTPTPSFDDLVIWISPNALTSLMVSAGKLP